MGSISTATNRKSIIAGRSRGGSRGPAKVCAEIVAGWLGSAFARSAQSTENTTLLCHPRFFLMILFAALSVDSGSTGAVRGVAQA